MKLFLAVQSIFLAFLLVGCGGSESTPSQTTCTSFTYSAWGACSNGMQSRTILTSSPAGCTGGSPVVSQSCGGDTSGGAPGGGGTEYHVGAGQTYTNLGAVPWYQLQAGDTVYVHPGTYHEKILISTSGTATQWIRVRGVPDASGNLPVISGDGATTSANNHWRWPDPALVQWDAVVAIAPSTDNGVPPHYVEIANLEVRDGSPSYSFTAENGASSPYEDFTACIYSRSPVHLLVRDNVVHNCGQGFYNWTGDGSTDQWWGALAADIVIRNNYFYDNGWANLYTSHQTYTEANGVVIEGNRFGTPKSGMLGNQIKDRSAGTVVRYNYIEQSPQGYDIDLVEPQEGCPSLCYSTGASISPNSKYLQAFVYGNIFVNRTGTDINLIHWNEDHQVGQGRAKEADGRLYFYNNTIVNMTNWAVEFNQTYGGYDCPSYALPGRIDFRNNIVYSGYTGYTFGEYCHNAGQGNFDFGVNWVSPVYTLQAANTTGTANLFPSSGNTPGFTNLATGDYTLASGSAAHGAGANLSPAVTSNNLGLDLTPTQQYVYPHVTPTPKTKTRTTNGAGSDLGALGQ